ncbi:hypothetical protein [Massilia sp. TSP1-1-2]|uniref:hypothetical protein n=1 Tax=Massilia sp. TSP1-1-2 TaxID=2804649 RepID=UPI003CFB3A69
MQITDSVPAEAFIHLCGDHWRAKQKKVFWLLNLRGELHQNIPHEHPAQGMTYHRIFPFGRCLGKAIQQSFLD